MSLNLERIRQKVNRRAMDADLRQDLSDLLAEVERLTTERHVLRLSLVEARDRAGRWEDTGAYLQRELDHVIVLLEPVLAAVHGRATR